MGRSLIGTRIQDRATPRWTMGMR